MDPKRMLAMAKRLALIEDEDGVGVADVAVTSKRFGEMEVVVVAAVVYNHALSLAIDIGT